MSNDGINVLAVNDVTNETFQGTHSEFKELFSSFKPPGSEFLYDLSGRPIGLLSASGSEVSLVHSNSNGVVFIGEDLLGFAEVTDYMQVTASGQLKSGPCELAGFDVVSGTGTLTIYDSLTASGAIIVPATAVSIGRTEFRFKRALKTGCYAVVSGSVTINILVS
jgi:hypothetical protein